MSDQPIDAMRCYCGEWVSVPHVECIANFAWDSIKDEQ